MNRTDRLYALVEELRASAPRTRSARLLAARFEVSTRTIERDILALQESGVPIWATPGAGGGYSVDPAATLPPINFTPSEAVALAIALAAAGPIPFGDAGQSALRKLVAAMSAAGRAGARDLVARIHLLADVGEVPRTPVLRAVEQAVIERRVLRIDYTDRDGGTTTGRDIEPLGFVGNPPTWYVIAWCRLRDGSRSFRLDRIAAATLTAEVATERITESVPEAIADRLRRPQLE